MTREMKQLYDEAHEHFDGQLAKHLRQAQAATEAWLRARGFKRDRASNGMVRKFGTQLFEVKIWLDNEAEVGPEEAAWHPAIGFGVQDDTEVRS